MTIDQVVDRHRNQRRKEDQRAYRNNSIECGVHLYPSVRSERVPRIEATRETNSGPAVGYSARSRCWQASFLPMPRLIQRICALNPSLRASEDARLQFLNHPCILVLARYRVRSFIAKHPRWPEPELPIVIGMTRHEDQLDSGSRKVLQSLIDR